MYKTAKSKSLIPALTAAAVAAFIFSPLHAADQNPFHMSDLSSGYVVASDHGKKGDGHGKRNKMKKMDTDGDGVVSKDEFLAHAEKKFAKKDKNGDGVLDADEMKKHCKYKKGKKDKDKADG